MPILLFCVLALGAVAGALVWYMPDETTSAAGEAEPDAFQMVNSTRDEGEGDEEPPGQDPAATEGGSGQAEGSTSLAAPHEDEPEAEARAEDEARDEADGDAEESEPGDAPGRERNNEEHQGDDDSEIAPPVGREDDRPDDEEDDEECRFWMWWC